MACAQSRSVGFFGAESYGAFVRQGHNPALRQLANRLVGILHGGLKNRTTYDEATAWSHRTDKGAA